MLSFFKRANPPASYDPPPFRDDPIFERAFAEAWANRSPDLAALPRPRRANRALLSRLLLGASALAIALAVVFFVLAPTAGTPLWVGPAMMGAGMATLFAWFATKMVGRRSTPKGDAALARFFADFVFSYYKDGATGATNMPRLDFSARDQARFSPAFLAVARETIAGRELDCPVIEYLRATGAASALAASGAESVTLSSAARLDFVLDGVRVVADGVLVSCVVVRTDKDGKRKRHTVVPFAGTVLRAPLEADYDGALEVATRGSGVGFTLPLGPQYELAGDEFNAELAVRFNGEDGAALRKALQPRMMAAFCDLSCGKRFGLVRTAPGLPATVFSPAASLGVGRYLAYSEAFARGETEARAATRAATAGLFRLIADLRSLVACDYLRPVRSAAPSP